MKVLVIGASGATGKLVVSQLMKRKIKVRILIRNHIVLPIDLLNNPLVEIQKGNISEMYDTEIENLIQGCDAIISCLGHNISLKGLFGKPRSLVYDAIQKICESVPAKSGMKLILMSTTAYTNTKSGEKNSLGERIIFSILKLFLPPHRDNVKTADYLLENYKAGISKIEWIAVRPDGLINMEMESQYEVQDTIVRSPIFDPGSVSRINVSHFMVNLLIDNELWQKWKFKMPVLYNVV